MHRTWPGSTESPTFTNVDGDYRFLYLNFLGRGCAPQTQAVFATLDFHLCDVTFVKDLNEIFDFLNCH